MQEEQMRELIGRIARQHLRVDTLEMQGRDQLDFHSLSVASIDRALSAAFQAGMIHSQVQEDDEQGAELRTLLNRLEKLYAAESKDWQVVEEPHNNNDGTKVFTHVQYVGHDIAGSAMKILIGHHLTPELAELMVLTHNHLGKLIRLARLGLDKRA